jgi:hypothetical protein
MTGRLWSRHTVFICAALGVLAGCGGGGASAGSPGIPNAQNAIAPQVEKSSIITVRKNGKPVRDADIKMAWGERCGLTGCHHWQKSGITGPQGTKEFKGLPGGQVYFCLEAKKGGSYALDCSGPQFI